VTVLGQPDAKRYVAGGGIAYFAVGEKTHPPGSLEARIKRMGKMVGPIGMRSMIRDVALYTDMMAQELPAALERIGADAMIADQMEPAGGLVAEALGLPFVTTATGLPINRELGVPPPYVAWDYDPSPAGRKRNRGGYRVSDWLMRGVGDVLERHCKRLGLPPRRRSDQFFSPRAELAQAVPGVDFPRTELPGSFLYLGPWRRDDAELRWEETLDGRPLVFCSLGTLQGNRAAVFRKVAAAAKQLDLQLLIAHGGRLDPKEVARLPGRPIVRDFVPQRAVLAKAALAVTHAGFNTVLDALEFGVPLVAIPLAFEQPATAARLRHAGVAEVVPPRIRSKGLAKAMRKVLDGPAYRERVAVVRKEIAQAGGVQAAADLVVSAV
jgi:zeaxanthin glucosyltransferase